MDRFLGFLSSVSSTPRPNGIRGTESPNSQRALPVHVSDACALVERLKSPQDSRTFAMKKRTGKTRKTTQKKNNKKKTQSLASRESVTAAMAVILFAYLIQVTIHDHEYQKKTSSLNHDLFLSTRRRRPNENPSNGEMMSWETKEIPHLFFVLFCFLSLSLLQARKLPVGFRRFSFPRYDTTARRCNPHEAIKTVEKGRRWERLVERECLCKMNR